MTKSEIEAFIEEMEEIGDIWEPDDVARVYGDMTLAEALDSRKADMGTFFDIIGKVINH